MISVLKIKSNKGINKINHLLLNQCGKVQLKERQFQILRIFLTKRFIRLIINIPKVMLRAIKKSIRHKEGNQSKEKQVLEDKNMKFTKFSICIPNMTNDHFFEKNSNDLKFDDFKVVIKNYTEREADDFSSFKIRVPELNEQTLDFEENSSFVKNDFIQFTRTRYKNSNSLVIDLKVCDLREVTLFLMKEKLMDERTYKKFQLNYKENIEFEFLEFQRANANMEQEQRKRKIQRKQKKIDERLKHFLKKTLFALIDHRIFCQMLILSFPQKYQMTEKPKCFFSETNQYLKEIYQMNLQDYLNYYNAFNKKYERFWIPMGFQLMENTYYFKQIGQLERRCSNLVRKILNLGYKEMI